MSGITKDAKEEDTRTEHDVHSVDDEVNYRHTPKKKKAKTSSSFTFLGASSSGIGRIIIFKRSHLWRWVGILDWVRPGIMINRLIRRFYSCWPGSLRPVHAGPQRMAKAGSASVALQQPWKLQR